ncbi:TonB-dependent receptor [Olivibacter sp. CPCC 100613]|uniref:SusC/RagA family TonB-linked outer membrane protein n=1 Tax=Olivibacter sp. CPCC 100613 TaxID=3079931 RepID=UPI002FF6DBD6
MKRTELLLRARGLFLCLLVLNLVALPTWAMQQGNMHGNVVDSLSGVAIPGVTVAVKGGAGRTTTDAAGNFVLVVKAGETLVFSSIGYKQVEISINNQAELRVKMSSISENLNEVVVVSYGTQNRRAITGAVSQLNASQVKDIPVANIGQKLQGRFSGVQINQNSGAPGANMSFRIRGAASINAGNNPLIVIDGFPSMSGLEAISPNEIETISVLKDASAASLYGSRASNGVILVTTKQGKRTKSVDFSAFGGVMVVPKKGRPDLMNAHQFAQFKKEYYEDAARYEGYTGGIPEVYQNPEQYGPKDGTDWYDVLLRNAYIQDYNLTLSAGGEDLKSLTTLSYNKQEGVVLNTFANRLNGRTNNVYNATENLTIGLNLAGTFRRSQVTPGLDNGRNIIQQAFLMDPTLAYKNPDGTYPVAFSQPGMFPNPNFYRVLTERINPVEQTTLLANAFASYKILPALEYKLSVNGNIENAVNRSFTPSTAQGGLGGAPPQPPSGNYNTTKFHTWLVENTLSYRVSFSDKHNIDAFVGYTFQKFGSENSTIQASEFPDDNVQWINAATTRIGNVGHTESSLLSYIGRLNYDFDNKYLFSVAFRRDGSSRFGSNKKYGNFPSVSVGWLVSEENFMQNVSPISLLKLRASYGKVGNNNIGDYTYLASVISDNYVFGNQVTPGKMLNGIGNAFLTWETTESYDLGMELGFFEGRLALTYDYYWKKTDGLLYAIDIPVQSGFNNITSNIGRFDFWGHEFAIESINMTGPFKWTTNLNISFDRNKVIKLGTNDAPIGGYALYWDDNRTAVGHPIGLFYGYINTGVYMTQEEFDSQPHGASDMVGTARFADVSGPNGAPDGIIDEHDRTFIGNPNPDFTYGITNTMSYKDFDLSVVMAGSVGNDIADDSFQSTENLDGVFNVRKDVANRWRSPENPGDGIYPRTRTGTTASFRNFTSRQVFSGTYLAIKNITLGYNLAVNAKSGIKRVRLYLSTQNPFIFSRYPGMNPEAGISGLNGLNQGRDFTAYPIAKTYTVGVNIGL